MAESVAYNVGEGSPEYVALKLLTAIANTEGKNIYPLGTGSGQKPEPKWILDTYAECLEATQGRRHVVNRG